MGRAMPPGFRFGHEVLVQATAERLTAKLVDGAVRYSEVLRARAGSGLTGNLVGTVYDQDHWPGAAPDPDWAPSPRGYPVEPVPTETTTHTRLRRMLRERPARGVVIGVTERQENSVVDGVTSAPSRFLLVMEIALETTGASRVELAFPQDLVRSRRRLT